MIVGIDIDDTITDSYEVLFNYAQEYTANVLKREPIIHELNNCNSHFYVKYLHGWSEQEEEQFFRLYYEKFLLNVKPKTLAVEYLKKLTAENHKIILITARWRPAEFELDVENITRQWITKYQIPYDKLIINAVDKEKIAKKEKIDVFIDDSFQNCQAVSDEGIKTFIMDTRVNRELNREDIQRVYSWAHIYWKLKNM